MAQITVVILECTELHTEGSLGDMLSDIRKKKLAKIRHFKSRCESLGAEYALCAALKLHGLPYHPPEYYYDLNGRPRLSSEPPFISLSHSHGYAACAIAATPVGLDIEVPRSVRPNLAAHILSPDEALHCRSTDELIEKWVIKESYLKLTGEGIFNGGMRDISAGNGIILRQNSIAAHYAFCSSNGLLVSCCCSQPPELDTKYFTAESLSCLLKN